MYLLKGIQESNSYDQTYRSKYPIQASQEFQIPCDLLPWLTLREKCRKTTLQRVNMPISTLMGTSPYCSIWGNWINFQTNMEFVHLVFILLISEALMKPQTFHPLQVQYE